MKRKLKRELIEWGVLLTVVGVLFITGWYKEVAGFLQRGILETGILKPSVSENSRPADYTFQLLDSEGRKVNFSNFEDKTVFLNIWATWCPPCIAEMPDINNLYKKVGDQVSFVMISVDNQPETALKFVERKGFDFPIYFLQTGLPAAYQSSSIPTTFIISPSGEIVVEEHGLSKYNTEEFRTFLSSLE